MKLTVFLFTAVFLQLSTKGFSQNVHFSGTRVPLEQVFAEVKKQTGFVFVYLESTLADSKPVSIATEGLPLEEFLTKILKDQPLKFSIKGKNVFISRNVMAPNGQEPSGKGGKDLPPPLTIVGKVLDEKALPLEGVSILLKGGKRGQPSNREGMFSIQVADEKDVIVISAIGYKTVEVKVWKNILKIIQLELATETMSEVVINNGMFDRNKQTFTGVTSTYSGKELRTVGRQNIIQSLKTLDPSFRVVDNNNFGSDPNKLPQIEFRGKTSPPAPGSQTATNQTLRIQFEQDPNQPLFILDGFEATLQQIVDLDINRVASVTLLKDAASTALYGSKASNGVVVVETIRPKPGDLSISYTATGDLVVPDLSGYNMMNSTELLKFQQLAINGYSILPVADQTNALIKYSNHQKEVLRGVNTYWLNVPVRNAYDLNHFLNISGGEQHFVYGVALNYGGNTGVMKGSSRKTQSASVNLSYRKGIWNVADYLTINGAKGINSPYGDFKDYVSTPPYYEKLDASNRYLEYTTIPLVGLQDPPGASTTFSYVNPLYNASLPYKNESGTFNVTNNLNINADITPHIRASFGFQYAKRQNTTDVYTSPLNTIFDNSPDDQKGRYDYTESKGNSFSGNAGLIYNNIFANKHIVNFNLRGSVNLDQNIAFSATAVGFTPAAQPFIFLGNSFLPDAKPGGSDTRSRGLSFIASLNYSYDRRFNFDLSFNRSGSNSFGSENPYTDFYSGGVGWNVGNEKFIKRLGWFKELRLSFNYGVTGNEYAGGYGSNTTYQLQPYNNSFGQSILISQLGVPYLQWSRTYTKSASLSFSLPGNLISLSLSGYEKKTDPMVIVLENALSTGLTGSPLNVGQLTTLGLECNLTVRPVQTRNWNWIFGLSAPVLKSRYSGLGLKLDPFNKLARSSNELERYIDGSSPEDVWAVRSVGIDPASGNELLLTKDGHYTTVFDVNDEVKVGTNRPVTGVINTSVYYKRFSISIYGRYVIGDLKFNSALFNKVENITTLDANYDKRALYDRWQKTGDVAYFKSLSYYGEPSNMSTRFLQKENAFYCESVSFNFDTGGKYANWIKKKLDLKGLNTSVNFNEFFKFQFSNVKMERGLDYPFARTISFSLNVVF